MSDLGFKEKKTLFVQVALPLPLESFTYRVPFELNDAIAIGQMVAVYFGRKNKKLYGGIVVEISEQVPKDFQASYIEEIVDLIPLISQQQLNFWKWIAQYYIAHLGDVMIAALPAGLRVSGETRIFITKNADFGASPLANEEIKILSNLEQNAYLTVENIQKKLGVEKPLRFIKSLYEKGLIAVADEILKSFKAKRSTYLKISANLDNEQALHDCLNSLEKRSPKQLNVLLFLLQNKNIEFEKKDLSNRTGASSAILKSMEEKGFVQTYFKEQSRIAYNDIAVSQFELSENQSAAVQSANQYFAEKKPVLLFGPTASGKTYVYLELIKQTLAKGKQVLYLLPEIALTEQMIDKLSTYLGDDVLVTHSKYSQNERSEVWDLLRSKAVNVIVGPRSAIFSPFDDLGLIIVDEEHENSFKQSDKSPRFHGRDAAIMLANIWGANIVLGSATPSLETMFAAQSAKYGLVKLIQKFDAQGKIAFEEVNLSEARSKNKLKEMFTFEMIAGLKRTLEEGKQAIIFHNRKGFVPITTCTNCGWVPHCINCDIALTYYKYNQEMRCHCCGFKSKPPLECTDCGSTSLQTEGYGTEKITEDLKIILPDARIERFDQESTKKKKVQKELIDGFTNKDIQILVGTQLLAKGFDFEDVDFVGVVNTDHMLYFPDFRSGERTFQLITQVAGRTGRRERVGKVMLQTQRPNHPVINAIMQSDYQLMYDAELMERKNYNYPPFSRLILIQIKNFNALDAEKAANHFANQIRAILGYRVFGPAKPIVSKVRRWYIRDILVKINRQTDDLERIKMELKQQISLFNNNSDFKASRLIINVDPA